MASFANNAIAISEWAYDKGTIQLSVNSDNCNLLIAGEINEDLRRVVTPAIESIVAASCKNKWIQLKSGGGRVSVALAIGRLIRDNNLNTEIYW